jgi:hypothetical protein
MLLNLMGHDVRMTYDGLSALKAATAFVPEVALRHRLARNERL